MGFGWAEVAGGAASVVGSVVQDHFNRRAANQQRDWEYNMSGSAHQREVADLKKAGLNPILSAGGQGASTPQGATMTPPTINLPGVMEMAQIKNATQQVKNDTDRVNIEKANSTASIAKNLSDAERNKADIMIKKGGIFSKYLGTEGATVMKKGVDTLKKYNPLNVPSMQQQPLNLRGPR